MYGWIQLANIIPEISSGFHFAVFLDVWGKGFGDFWKIFWPIFVVLFVEDAVEIVDEEG